MFDPQIRFPWHSESLSQSPSLIAQGTATEQHSQSKFVPLQDSPEILKEILISYFRLEHSGDLYFNFVNFWLKVAYLLYAIINLNTASFLVMDGQVFFLFGLCFFLFVTIMVTK